MQARAVLESQHGSLAQARAFFQRGLEVDPSDAKMWQASATSEAHHGNMFQAREHFQQGLNIDPSNCFLLQV